MAESADGIRPGAMPCQLLDHGTGYLRAAAALRALDGRPPAAAPSSASSAWPGPRSGCSARTVRPGLAVTRPDRGEEAWLTTIDGPDGPVTTVLPPGQLGGAGFSWPGPLSRYGSDKAAWRQVSLGS